MARPGFFAELKRRNVLRASAFYVAAVWALSQGISQLSPAFGLPDWATRWFVIACAIGFPFWVAFAWFYEWTPQGLKRESEVERSESITRQTGRKLDYWIIGALTVAVVLLGSGYFIRRHAPAVATRATAAAFDPPADSIMVLPFANLSDDPKQQYFSNGITEELTGALGQNTGLAVIAWDTAAHYRGSTQTPAEIGKVLNVAHILDGSIQREGDEVRVSVELVSTVTGRQLWSAHYDDSLQNIFAVQDQISAAIAGALKVKFAGLQAVPTLNPLAHEWYLKGLGAMNQGTDAGYAGARRNFEQAIALDPKYADAYGMLAQAYLGLSEMSTLTLEEALPKMRAAAHEALALDPRNVNALVALGTMDFVGRRFAQAKLEYRQALELDPSNAAAHRDYGLLLPLRPGLAQQQEAVLLDPVNARWQNDLAVAEWDLGEYQQALVPELEALRLSPHNVHMAFHVAFLYHKLHRDQDAVNAFALVKPVGAQDRQLVAAGRLAYESLLKPELRTQARAAVAKLRHAGLDPFSQFNLVELDLVALGEQDTALQTLSELCARFPIGCSDLAVNPLYQDVRGDPRFKNLSKRYTPEALGSAPASASSR